MTQMPPTILNVMGEIADNAASALSASKAGVIEHLNLNDNNWIIRQLPTQDNLTCLTSDVSTNRQLGCLCLS